MLNTSWSEAVCSYVHFYDRIVQRTLWTSEMCSVAGLTAAPYEGYATSGRPIMEVIILLYLFIVSVIVIVSLIYCLHELNYRYITLYK